MMVVCDPGEYISSQDFVVFPPLVDPVFMVLDPGLNTNWGRVLLATCITITPGTITVDIDPETGHFIVHALTEQTGRICYTGGL